LVWGREYVSGAHGLNRSFWRPSHDVIRHISNE